MTLLFCAAAVGVALGRAMGGRLAHLCILDVRCAWLAPLALGLQLCAILAPPTPPDLGPDPVRFWLPATTAALAAFVAANLRVRGMRLLLLGLSANLAVILANGGLMPTNVEALAQTRLMARAAPALAHPGMRLPRSKDTPRPIEETRLWPLSDVLVGPPLPWRVVMSVGDLVLTAGLAVVIAAGMGTSPVATPVTASPPWPARAVPVVAMAARAAVARP